MSSFQAGGTKLERLCLRINIPIGNYWVLRIGVLVTCQKLDIVLVIKWFKNWCYQNTLIKGCEEKNSKCVEKRPQQVRNNKKN